MWSHRLQKWAAETRGHVHIDRFSCITHHARHMPVCWPCPCSLSFRRIFCITLCSSRARPSSVTSYRQDPPYLMPKQHLFIYTSLWKTYSGMRNDITPSGTTPLATSFSKQARSCLSLHWYLLGFKEKTQQIQIFYVQPQVHRVSNLCY
jgi:hypothetical protein